MLQLDYIPDIHGTIFPANPYPRQIFYRDDLNQLFWWNGAIWVAAGGVVLPHHLTHELGGADQVMGTAPATPLALIHRDAAGRAQIADPAANPDIDNLGSRNVAIAAEAAARAAADAAETAARTAADAAEAAARAAADAAEIVARNAAIEVHRVGAVHTLPQPPSAHAPSHGWLNTDEVAIGDRFLNRVNPLWYKTWNNLDGFTENHTIGKGFFTQRFGIALLYTTADAGARALVYEPYGLPVYHSAAYNPRFALQINQYTPSISKNAWFGLYESPITPSPIQKKIGFHIIGNSIYAECGDGFDQNWAYTGVGIGQFVTRLLFFKMVGTTIYFYIDGVLTNTFTTYAPTNWETAKITLHLVNILAEANTFKIFPLMLMLGSAY